MLLREYVSFFPHLHLPNNITFFPCGPECICLARISPSPRAKEETGGANISATVSKSLFLPSLSEVPLCTYDINSFPRQYVAEPFIFG